MPDEDRLSEAPDRDEAEEDLERVADAALKRYDTRGREQLSITVQQLGSLQDSIDLKMFRSTSLEGAWTDVQGNELEDVAMPGAKSALEREDIAKLEERARKLLRANDAIYLREYNLRRFMAGMLGLNIPSVAASSTFELMARSAGGLGTADIPVPKDVKVNLEEITRRLMDEGDKAFWNRLAAFAQSNSVTAVDLLYFMQYTQQLFPLKEPFIWESNVVRADKIAAIVKTGMRGGSADVAAAAGAIDSTAFLSEPTIISIPRSVAASYAGLAFAVLASESAAGATSQ